MRGTQMRVGCPKEIKNHEYRVGLTPASVREYVAHGHDVWVETKAGAGIGADDAAYAAAGAKIAASAKDIFEKCDMIVKVKEPQPSEWAQLRDGQLLYTYLHLAPDPEQAKGLIASGVTAVAYETVTDERGGLPLLAPMSEVAGRLSIQAGATALQKANGGLGVLLGGVPGVLPAKVTVIGGGVVGLHAARMAAGLGADVSILDKSLPRLRQLDDIFAGRVHTRYSSIQALEEEVFSADLVIGAVLIPGAAAPKLVTREMLSGMKTGSVIVDVAIDQGGCFETSHATTHSDPTYEVDGVVHYCVANMPGAVPVTSAHALNNATLVHGLALADRGLRAIAEDKHLRNGLNVHKGRITSKPVAEALGYEVFAPESVLNVA
ncbi:alanine dehydrogenase [Rhizobium lentis]|uniref:Alanine dehydrogenase n=2 Tax=Rhizobium lentis TaxID=1138194 RepID=A0A7W8UMD7_9HYPH|nr:alanine dehydrogenase [Rhizobium lentis]MBB5550409.1 alanine dehydrogenase [Rhizobium lentis]MBB5560563.1 alanine dehydrogenase [Rhizobium lentis]MBB5567148.1 alanine dehydrogenase [Rhizobium lentis]